MSVRMESQAGTSRAAESAPHQYDVFINHRGPDVKDTFVAHLYAAFKDGGLRPFLDANDIELCRDVDISIDEALKGSHLHVAIFSERYAESKHCLDELCMMLESGKDILPVFYHVEPSDLRMRKNGPFKEGFTKLVERETEVTEEQISKWKQALCIISGYMGMPLNAVKRNEAELVRNIQAKVRQLMLLAEGRRLMSNVLPGAIEGVEPPETEIPRVGGIGRVDPPVDPDPKAREGVEPVVTFNPGNRGLNILVLGDPDSVEAVCSRICGAGRRQIPVEGHVNLRECRNSSPPMCLYSHTQGFNRNDFTDFRTFVKVRNKKWRREKVKALWEKEVHLCPRRGPRKPGPGMPGSGKPGPRKLTLFPGDSLRLHAIWFVCRNLSDLPNHLDWPEITEKLCGLPVQILVTQDLDMNDEEKFNKILEFGSVFFPKARMFIKDNLIVKVSLQDNNLKGELWCKCWAVKTPAEIGNVAKIMWEIRKRLGSAGKSVLRGLGGARLRKEVSLSRSAEFFLDFLCTYWEISHDSLRRVLQGTTTFRFQARGIKISIEPCKFVEFCLKVAAIILYNARNPNVSSESSLDQLQTEARGCYNFYFAPSTSESSRDYDTMVFEDIRLFLESIFERKRWDPRPVVSADRDSFISKILKRICPRGKSASPGTTPSKL